MADNTQRRQDGQDDGTVGDDDPIPRASDEKVLEETARMAREGRQQLESDPRERKPGTE